MSELARDWSWRHRAAWWAKLSAMVASAIVGLAGAGKLLGLRFDVQTQTDAKAQHDEMKKEARENDEKILQQVGAKIDRLDDKIQAVILSSGRRR